MYILYAHHNDSCIKMSASTFSLVASLTSFCNALYLRAVLIRYFLLFLYICNNPCFLHLKKRCSPYKIVFTNIHFILYLCIFPHTKFSYAAFSFSAMGTIFILFRNKHLYTELLDIDLFSTASISNISSIGNQVAFLKDIINVVSTSFRA